MNARACSPGNGIAALSRLPQLAEPLLRFDLPEELEELRSKESWLRETGRSSKTLVKYPDFRIVLILMKANTHMIEPKAEGRISLQHLLGRMCVHLPDRKIEVSSGQLLVLDCGMLHNIEALEESAFLLTISWDKGRHHASELREHRLDEEALSRMDGEGGSPGSSSRVLRG